MHDAPGLEVLTEGECRRILATEPVGRLGFSSRALPVIFPVNYRLQGGRVFIASESGSKVDAARRGVVACLEVDGFDTLEHGGWSVLATGHLSLVDEAPSAAEHLTPWATSNPEHLIALDVELLTGRRIRHPEGAHHLTRFD